MVPHPCNRTNKAQEIQNECQFIAKRRYTYVQKLNEVFSSPTFIFLYKVYRLYEEMLLLIRKCKNLLH